MKITKNSRGFTLTETLVSVAVIVLLIAIACTAVIGYRKPIAQLQLDGIAKELFISAQKNLSMAKGQNYLGRENIGRTETDTFGKPTDIYYYIVGDGDSPDDETSVLNLILPWGSIDEEVRSGGNYIIRYEKSTGLILDVFYAKKSESKYGHDFTESEYAKLIADFRGAEHKSDRRSSLSDDAVIGYYGGVEPAGVGGTRISAPDIRLINGETLSVKITYPDSFLTPDTVVYRLEITGEKSGAAAVITLNPLADAFVILDDVTNENGNRHFAAVCPMLTPGENISVRAYAYDTESGREEESAAEYGNSLFANCDGETAVISVIRHLENLESQVSYLGIPVKAAVQTNDLVWDNRYSAVRITNPMGAALTTEDALFFPVSRTDSTCPLSYDGNSCKISGITVKCADNAGLFGMLIGGSVKNLVLLNTKIRSTYSGTENVGAGALAGTLLNTEVEGVLAYSEDAAVSEEMNIRGKYAGGLVGYMNGGSVNCSAAAIYVHSDKKDGAAGGLIGYAAGTRISDSYAGGRTENGRYFPEITGNGHINVFSAYNAAGGFIGWAGGKTPEMGVIIDFCYTTASVRGVSAAGFIGSSQGNVHISNCYSAGLVAGYGKNYVHGVFYTGTKPEFHEKSYYISDMSGEDISFECRNSDPALVACIDKTYADGFIPPKENRMSAYAYDITQQYEYLGKFPYPTVKQLHENSGDTSFPGIPQITSMHYGDWQAAEVLRE